ncbi:MAG: cupin domain-containing protein [Cyanobacteria bacterium P01_G01_bin.38]
MPRFLVVPSGVRSVRTVQYSKGATRSIMPLHNYQAETVALVCWEADTYFQRHTHLGGEEIFVVEGTFEDEQGIYPKGIWLRNPVGSIHAPFSRQGCIIYVKVQHLPA